MSGMQVGTGKLKSRKFKQGLRRFHCRRCDRSWQSPLPHSCHVESPTGERLDSGPLCPYCQVNWYKENFGCEEILDA